MNKYKVALKCGAVAYAECKYVDILTVQSMLNEHQPFIRIGDSVFAKDTIAMIEKIKEEKLETAEKEN